MPLMMWGIGSEAAESIETWAIRGFTLIAERTMTTPRSNGPTIAESIATIENGCPP